MSSGLVEVSGGVWVLSPMGARPLDRDWGGRLVWLGERVLSTMEAKPLDAHSVSRVVVASVGVRLDLT